MCAAFEPGEELIGLFAHLVLHIDLGVAFAGPGQRQTAQGAGVLQLSQLFLVEEIRRAALVAEEQPRGPCGPCCAALLQEGAERRDPCPGSHHDDRLCTILGQGKAVRLLHVDFELVAGRNTIVEEGRGDALAQAIADRVAHGIGGERNAAGFRLRRRRDRVETRLERLQRLHESLGIGMDAGKLLQRRQNVERLGVAVGVLSLGEFVCLFPALSPRKVRNQLEQSIGSGRKRRVLDQHLAQRLLHDREVGGHADSSNNLVGQGGLVRGIDSETVADLVVEPTLGQVDDDVIGNLLRAGPVQPAPRHEGRGNGSLTAVAWARIVGLRKPRRFLRRLLVRIEHAAAHLLDQRLQHARRRLAARNAEIEARLGLLGDGAGVVLAIVAALAAILLAHRRHHAPPQRPPLGQRHALIERHGRIVPGRLIVIAVRGRRIRPCRQLDRPRRRQRGAGIDRQKAGEEAVEPGTLLGAEGRRFRNERRAGRWRLHRHAACSSTNRFKASVSWRLAKAKKGSSLLSRCAR